MPAGAGRVRMRMRKRGGRGGSVPGALKYPGGGIFTWGGHRTLPHHPACPRVHTAFVHIGSKKKKRKKEIQGTHPCYLWGVCVAAVVAHTVINTCLLTFQ